MRELCALSLLSATLLGAAELENDEADVVAVAIVGPETRALLPSGKEVDAIDGDIILRNPFITAVIARPVSGRDANLTTSDVGGCLIDLTTTENGSDQLNVFRPLGYSATFRSAEIIPNGGEPISLEEFAPGEQLPFTSGAFVRVASADGQQAVSYLLFPDSQSLLVKYRVDGDLPPMEFRVDGGLGRVAMAKPGRRDWWWIEDVFWRQSYGVRTTVAKVGVGFGFGPQLDVETNVRRGKLSFDTTGFAETQPPFVGLMIAPAANRLEAWATLFPDAPKSVLTLSYNQIGNRSLATVDTTIARRVGQETEELARLRVRSGSQGVTSVPVPPGPIEVTSSSLGLVETRHRYHAVAGQVEVHGDSILMQNGESPPHRELAIRVRDESDWPVPAKVALTREPDKLSDRRLPNFGPDTAEHRVKNLLYIVNGQENVLLPGGRYQLRATHGPEYHQLVREVSLFKGAGYSTTLTLQRAYETPGWISADFHSHSSPSGDNTSSQRGRVLNLVCEDIDFAPCTEHNRVSSYQNHIDELGIGNDLLSCPGIEVTGRALPINHHNAFPMRHTPFVQNGGGPRVADNPDDQVERIYLWDDRSTKVIQQNHPDIGWLFRDRDGDGEIDDGFAKATGLIDCIEVHPIEAALNVFPNKPRLKGDAAEKWNRRRFFEWLQLLNQGRRLPGVVNTDSHYNFHGSGWLRNWIRVPDDEPSQCSIEDIVEATKAGRVIMSNGPMLEMSLTNSAGDRGELGDELRAADGVVEANVRIRCADWVDVDRVAIFVDGRIAELFTIQTHPEMFHEGVVRFEQTVPLQLDHDAPVLAICGSGRKTLGEVYGPDHADRYFAAATNPVWVNVGDEAYEPSGDLLDKPLRGKVQ